VDYGKVVRRHEIPLCNSWAYVRGAGVLVNLLFSVEVQCRIS